MNSRLRAVGLTASPGGSSSRSSALLDVALARLAERDVTIDRFDLTLLPAEGLLGRARSPQVAAALAAVSQASLVLVATPIYRATYAGLLKVFFDLLPADALAGKIAIPIAAAGGPAHLLALDHGLRPLLASVGAVVVSSGIYASPEQFADGAPADGLLERVERAVAEALTLAGRITGPVPELVSQER